MFNQAGDSNAVADKASAVYLAHHDTQEMHGQHPLNEYEEEFPVYRSIIKDLPRTPSYDLPDVELRHIPEGNEESGWQKCLLAVEKYDRDLCQTYREQIDTLLVFAGLFSAVVTAFVVESYQWLQDDPLDTSVELLRDMVVLLSQNLNLTAEPTPVQSAPISGSAVARINTFWFLSLSLSLSAALVGILCKQWLREFERDVGRSPKSALAVRHIRFQGFEYWKVGSIVMFVPIIMQVALAFFMIGIIELLWRLHVVVACFVTAVAGLTLLFFLATTFLPVIQYAYICVRCCIQPLKPWNYSTLRAFTEPQCAFKSAQSWLVFRTFRPLIERMLRTYGHQFSPDHPRNGIVLGLHPADSWVTFDLNWIHRREHVHHGPRCAFESLAWIATNLGDAQLSSAAWHCVWAHWLKSKSRNTRESITMACWDIGSVASTYRVMIPPNLDIPPDVRAQALVFHCSLRVDIPVETAIELLLRAAPMVGINSLWTCQAVSALLRTYQDLPFQISDGLAVGLFRLAEMQTYALIVQPGGPMPETQLNGANSFKDILRIIHRGSRLRNTLLVAMSGLALQWLRTNPPVQVALVARSVFEDVVRYLGTCADYAEDWHCFPGIVLVAKLAETVSALWPDFVRNRYIVDRRRELPILQDLLAMLSDGPNDTVHARSDSVASHHSPSVHGADEERSSPPVADGLVDTAEDEVAHTEAHGPLSLTGGPSMRSSHAHPRLEVRGEVKTNAPALEIDINCPASPSTSSVLPTSAPENRPYPHSQGPGSARP